MRRIEFASLLAALGGLILLVSLFLHWYQPALTAWTAFEVWDLVLAALALAAVWMAVASAVWGAPLREGALPVLGGSAFIIVVSQLVNHPPAAEGASVQAGAWLALLGSALMAMAGVLKGANVSLSVTLSQAPRGRERRSGPPPAYRHGEPSPANEAAEIEPEVHDELYPAEERRGPIGADDPEPWTAGPEDETHSFEPEGEERS
jgi:hypothetical protein